jgi:hypothetical protein
VSSVFRSVGVALTLVAAMAVATFAQDGFRGRGRSLPDLASTKVDYNGQFAFVRVKYLGGFSRDPGWAHDYPRADWHLQRILEDVSFTRTHRDESNILTLDDPELALYPVAYMSEPGFWTLTEAEASGLRSYLQKGGFIIFDDFRGARDWGNLEARMADVMPDLRWVTLDASHPVFHSFFDIHQLVTEGYYGPAEFRGLFEDNDPTKRLVAVANVNHDLGEFWEFSDTGWMPVDLSNEAYKYGVNYVIYAMTH